MNELINRFKEIQCSSPSNVKLKRLHSLKSDLEKIYQTNIGNPNKELVAQINKDCEREIDRTVRDLDKAVAVRRDYF